MMFHFLSSMKGGLSMVSICAVGGAGAMVAEAISDNTTVQIGLVAMIGVGLFRAGQVLQKLKDEQRQANARLSRIERKLDISEDEETKEAK